jgi:hypothetical protein
MNKQQIIWQIVIGLLLLAWEVLKPLLERMRAWVNRPSPLSPKDKGKLLEQILMQEQALERLNHFSQHPKDLFLFLYQVAGVALLFFMAAVCTQFYGGPGLLLLFVTLSAMMVLLGILEASRMSDKKIEATRAGIQKSIDDAKQKLNTPV